MVEEDKNEGERSSDASYAGVDVRQASQAVSEEFVMIRNNSYKFMRKDKFSLAEPRQVSGVHQQE